MKRLVVALLATSLLSGCVVRVADLEYISTKELPLDRSTLVEGKVVTGKSMRPIAIVPFGIPSIDKATDDALSENSCVVGLKDVTVDRGYLHLLMLPLGTNWYTVEGTQLIDTGKYGCQ